MFKLYIIYIIHKAVNKFLTYIIFNYVTHYIKIHIWKAPCKNDLNTQISSDVKCFRSYVRWRRAKAILSQFDITALRKLFSLYSGRFLGFTRSVIVNQSSEHNYLQQLFLTIINRLLGPLITGTSHGHIYYFSLLETLKPRKFHKIVI